MAKSKNKSGFTDEDIRYFKAMLFGASLQNGCISSNMYAHYMGAYNNEMAEYWHEEAEKYFEGVKKEEAIAFLEKLGYDVKLKG